MIPNLLKDLKSEEVMREEDKGREGKGGKLSRGKGQV